MTSAYTSEMMLGRCRCLVSQTGTSTVLANPAVTGTVDDDEPAVRTTKEKAGFERRS